MNEILAEKAKIHDHELANGKVTDDAAVSAGYKPSRSNSSSLKAKQHISKRVSELLQENGQVSPKAMQILIERTAITKQFVLEALMENYMVSSGRKPVRIGKVGDDGELPKEKYIYDGATVSQSLKLMGLELAMFIERKDFRVMNDFEKLSDAELVLEMKRTAELLIEHQSDKPVENE